MVHLEAHNYQCATVQDADPASSIYQAHDFDQVT